MRPRRKSKELRRGYSLAELILGAGILAIFSLRIYESYSSTSQADQYENFVNQMNLVSGVAVTMNGVGGDYSTVDNTAVAGSLPTSMVLDANAKPAKLVSAYRHSIDIKPIDIIYGGSLTTAGGLELSAPVPRPDCFKLATGAPGLFKYIGTGSSSGNDVAFPLNNAQAVSVCGSLQDITLVTVRLSYMPYGASLNSGQGGN